MSLFGRDYDPYLGMNIKDGMTEIAGAIRDAKPELDRRLQFTVNENDETKWVKYGTREYGWLTSEHPCIDDGTSQKVYGKYYVPYNEPAGIVKSVVTIYSGTPVKVTSVNRDNDDGAYFTYHKITGYGKPIKEFTESKIVPAGENPSLYAKELNKRINVSADMVWESIKKQYGIE